MNASATPIETSARLESSRMRAATFSRYGSPDVVTLGEADIPTCGPNDVVIRVHAASVNPYDWHMMTGTPLPMRLQSGLLRPKETKLGLDVAGVVEAVGPDVSRFSPGDAVFGAAAGAFAEVAKGTEATLTHKPAEVSFEAAAAVPVAGLTALQGLRDHGALEPGSHVAINGAAGGVGTYAVQLAKHLGARVTAVCSTRNVEMVRRLGADRVVDYTQDDFTADADAYAVVIDNIGNKTVSSYKRCLVDEGVLVVVGGPKGTVLAPIPYIAKTLVAFKFAKQRAVSFTAQPSAEDLAVLAELLASGTLVSEIERSFPLAEVADALRHLETGRTRGKIIITP